MNRKRKGAGVRVPVLIIFIILLIVTLIDPMGRIENKDSALGEADGQLSGLSGSGAEEAEEARSGSARTLEPSAESGFYNQNLSVELTVRGGQNDAMRIWYTLGGADADPAASEEPGTGESALETAASDQNVEETADIASAEADAADPENTEVLPYSGGIELTLPDSGETQVYILKASLYENGILLDRCEKTYILGENVTERYDLDVISVSSDSRNLYDYSTGIMVFGAEYDRAAAEGEENSLGNLAEDWTRDAHVTMFGSDGSVKLDDDCGLSLSGGTSRGAAVKSLMLTAGGGKDPESDVFALDVFEDEDEVSDLPIVTEYKRIRLRSGAQDRTRGNIRSAVFSRLAREAGYAGCADTHRAVVYLNGEYYGVCDMQDAFSGSYIARRFGLETADQVEKAKGTERDVMESLGVRELFEADLTDDSNRTALEAAVDMDDYLTYCALEILADNTDWPGNNFEAWRYDGFHDEANPWSDGRVRFYIYDTDVMWHTVGQFMFFTGADGDILDELMQKTARSADSVFSHVMECQTYRHRFLSIVSELMDGVFSTDHVLGVIDEETERVRAEYRLHGQDTEEEWEEGISTLRANASEREESLRGKLGIWFGASLRYTLHVTAPEGVRITLPASAVENGSDITEKPYIGNGLILTAAAYPGYEFDHWEVNGENVSSEASLTLDTSLTGTEADADVEVTAAAVRKTGALLLIDEISSGGTDDWIRICNAGTEPAGLSGFCLSDDEDDLFMCRLPSKTLAPGESVLIYGSKNREAPVGSYVCNFSLGRGETLYLTDNRDGSTADSLKIPRIEPDETYGRYQHGSRWVYYDNRNGQRTE